MGCLEFALSQRLTPYEIVEPFCSVLWGAGVKARYFRVIANTRTICSLMLYANCGVYDFEFNEMNSSKSKTRKRERRKHGKNVAFIFIAFEFGVYNECDGVITV